MVVMPLWKALVLGQALASYDRIAGNISDPERIRKAPGSLKRYRTAPTVLRQLKSGKAAIRPFADQRWRRHA